MRKTMIRYAIQVTKPELPKSPPFFMARRVGIHNAGDLSLYVFNAKTFASEQGAQRWVAENQGRADWWLAQGWTFKAIPVVMRSATVPVAVWTREWATATGHQQRGTSAAPVLLSEG